MLTDYFFWFAQPSSTLNDYDKASFYLFAGLVALSAIFWLVNKFLVRHDVTKKLVQKYYTALFWFGLVGLVWFGFRYEAVPIFSRRWFAGSIIALGLIWLGWVKYYFVFKYRQEKQEHDALLLKNKYIR